MKLLVWLLAFLAGCDAGCARADATEFVAVIVGRKTPDIGHDGRALRDIFLRRVVVDDRGKAVVPINLPPENATRMAFTNALWGTRPLDQQRYWNEQYFHGTTPPYVVRSEEAMLRFVTDTGGAIGYVASCHLDARVQIVARLSIAPELLPAVHASCAH